MRYYTVTFWDNPTSPTPGEIDALTVHSYTNAEEVAEARAVQLREKYGNQVGYKIEGPSDEPLLTSELGARSQGNTSR